MPEDFEEKMPQKTQTCPAVGVQTANVCLPVKVSPFSVTGPARVHCCGEPLVLPHNDHCHGKPNGTCEFTISQKIKVEIPVEFGATVHVGDTFVDCGCSKCEEPKKDCDCDCGDLEK